MNVAIKIPGYGDAVRGVWEHDGQEGGSTYDSDGWSPSV